MSRRHIIYIPGKDPKPPVEQHTSLLWRALLEGVRRAQPSVADDLSHHSTHFELIAWNHHYYHASANIDSDLPWINAILEKKEPTSQDIADAHAWHLKLDRLLYNIIDYFPFLLKFLAKDLRDAAEDTQNYFKNKDNIACEVRELLKQQLRPILDNDEPVLVIGHSLGSVIAYDTLWELSHLEKIKGKVSLFLTVGSPLGMNYVQHRLMGSQYHSEKSYPRNIQRWENISAVGDITALDRSFADDFSEMLNLGLVGSIKDHCHDIYNFFRNDDGLNCHRSYGYLTNPVMGKVIADWWLGAATDSNGKTQIEK